MRDDERTRAGFSGSMFGGVRVGGGAVAVTEVERDSLFDDAPHDPGFVDGNFRVAGGERQRMNAKRLGVEGEASLRPEGAMGGTARVAGGTTTMRTSGVAGIPTNSQTADFIELSPKRALVLLSRGIRLRCPNCGEGRLRETWLSLKPKCPVCGLRTDRGEQDFFLGGMMWNIVFAEGALLLTGLLIGILTWPDVPWKAMQWVGMALMVLVPFVFYPFSLGFWLANDIWIRPITETEMEWHRASKPGEFRPQEDR